MEEINDDEKLSCWDTFWYVLWYFIISTFAEIIIFHILEEYGPDMGLINWVIL